MNWLFAFLHHAAAFALVAALAVELVLIRDELTVRNARRLIVADAVYGVSAGTLLAVGLARVFLFEKGASYYFQSAPFLAKLALFVAIGLASIIPTFEFLSWRGAVRGGVAPAANPAKLRTIRRIVHLELAGVLLMLLCAAMMARGVGILGA
jgi:putative membrane protein